MEFIQNKYVVSGGFPDLDVSFNSETWGPIIGKKLSIFENIPYAHFDKKEKCNRAADFTQNPATQQKWGMRPRKYDEAMGNADFAYKHDVVEDSTFQLVDTSKAQSRNKFSGTKKTWTQPNARNANVQNRTGGRQVEPLSIGNRGRTQKPVATQQQQQQQRRKFNRNTKFERTPSLAIGASWVVIEEFDLPQLTKLVANKPVIEDLMWCGTLDQYDESYDKASARLPRVLKRVENKVFYGVTTTEDPIIEKFAVEEVGNVFATDAILSHLISAPRSVFSWDIVIQKVDGVLFLDKREDSQFDLLTVSETANEPPTASEDIDEYNHPEKLAIEATLINQNFSQQILKENSEETRKTYEENPFFEDNNDGTEPASVAYRYRKFTLGNNIQLVVRCELHAWAVKGGAEQFLTCYALNEWDSRYSGGIEWRQKIDQQKGAVLGTELKNNSCKLAKWTAQSLLAGADLMKLGFISRAARTNPYDHTILGTQFFKPLEFATQIALNVSNIWGIIKMICELLMNQEDGKYVLFKDPNKPTVRLFSVPINTFESDEEIDEAVDGNDDNGDYENRGSDL